MAQNAFYIVGVGVPDDPLQSVRLRTEFILRLCRKKLFVGDDNLGVPQVGIKFSEVMTR